MPSMEIDSQIELVEESRANALMSKQRDRPPSSKNKASGQEPGKVSDLASPSIDVAACSTLNIVSK